jgi:NADH-quinone oxidoreductase subunit L
MLVTDIAPWLCWIFPVLGALLALVLNKVNRKAMNYSVIAMAALGWAMALLLIPSLFNFDFIDNTALWFSLPGGASISLGMLLDPLSIIIVNIVAFLGFLIVIYSSKYMEDDPNIARFWFFMSLFIGSMLLLVLADNFILMFFGWKLVGVCSFGLIGFYYLDKKEHWIGGPAPFPFQKPSRSGLKALLVTTFGDVPYLLAKSYFYLLRPHNQLQRISTARNMAASYGCNSWYHSLTCYCLLLGPFAKSAHSPFHEWLP